MSLGARRALLDVFVDRGFEGFERAADFDLGGWLVGVEQWSEQAVLEFGVEDRDADAFGGEEVGVAVGQALDESVQAQAAEVVAHLAGGCSPGRGVRRRAREGFCW